MKILLITEQREAKWNKVSFETLAAAQQIAQQTKGTISAVVIGKGVAALADELADINSTKFFSSNTNFSPNTRLTAMRSRSSR